MVIWLARLHFEKIKVNFINKIENKNWFLELIYWIIIVNHKFNDQNQRCGADTKQSRFERIDCMTETQFFEHLYFCQDIDWIEFFEFFQKISSYSEINEIRFFISKRLNKKF